MDARLEIKITMRKQLGGVRVFQGALLAVQRLFQPKAAPRVLIRTNPRLLRRLA